MGCISKINLLFLQVSNQRTNRFFETECKDNRFCKTIKIIFLIAQNLFDYQRTTRFLKADCKGKEINLKYKMRDIKY